MNTSLNRDENSPIGEEHAVAAARRRQSAHYEGAKRAEDAQAAWNRGVPGHYVRNADTLITVRGPYDTLTQAQVVADGETFASWEVITQ